MTEQEQKAIKWMKNVRDDAVVTLDHIAKEEPNVSPMLYAGRKAKAETIINGFDELEKYRAIGTVEDIQQKLTELKRWHTYRLAINVKNPFAKMSTSICHNCDHKDEYIEELEAEIKEYKAIGDFAELVEKWCWKHQYYNQDDLNELMEIAEQFKGGGVDEV